jgi:hypothetical protein
MEDLTKNNLKIGNNVYILEILYIFDIFNDICNDFKILDLNLHLHRESV